MKLQSPTLVAGSCALVAVVLLAGCGGVARGLGGAVTRAGSGAARAVRPTPIRLPPPTVSSRPLPSQMPRAPLPGRALPGVRRDLTTGEAVTETRQHDVLTDVAREAIQHGVQHVGGHDKDDPSRRR
jgi:hypothetical protein